MTDSLFSNLAGIRLRLEAADHVLLGLDFDGTLTPIVDDPAQAKLGVRIRSILLSLAAKSHYSVGIVSGRALDDLRSLVGLDGLIYAGNHGLDISGPGLRFVEPEAVAEQEALSELSRTLALRLHPIAGAFVEDKALTISAHFRQVAASEMERVFRTVEDTASDFKQRFQVTLGRKVFEFRPRVNWHIGKAVQWIKDQLRTRNALVIYLGDDETDEDAFDALADEITIKVGQPADSSAQYYVEAPSEVEDFLRWVDHISCTGN